MWECGLKQHLPFFLVYQSKVTPHVGVWIETNEVAMQGAEIWSLPMWECGLKRVYGKEGRGGCAVTPHVGVWIEWGWLKIELTPNVQRTECCLD